MTATATTPFPILATAAREPLPLVVSLHDVAPVTRATSEKMLHALHGLGVRATSLLVVPNYHRGGAMTDDRDFLQWLRDLEAAGHEIVIHGYYHERPRAANESLAARLVTRAYTQDEGEFYDLGYEEAFARITRAREEFKRAGLQPRGFIAPAWLLSAAGERAARDAEMEYTTRLTNVRDLRSGATFPARSLVYSVRSAWRRALSLAWNGTLSRLQLDAPLVRLSLHPPDHAHPEIWAQVLRLAARLAETRTPTTYCDWIAEQRRKAPR